MTIRTHIARAAMAVTLGATVLTGLPTLAVADTSAELQTKLDEANAHLNDLYSQAEQVSEQVNQTQADLDSTNSEIEQKQQELSSAQDVLAKRVASNYKTGGVSLASILFDSTSFEDLINRVTYASKVSDSDTQVIQQVRDIQNDLDEKQAQQQQLLSDQQTQQAELNDKVNEAQSYVSSLDQQVQDKLAEEQAAREAEQEAARQQAEQAAANNNGNYVENTDNGGGQANNATNNTTTNNNTANNGGSHNSGNSNSGSSNSGNSGSGSHSGSTNSSARNAIVAAAWSKVGCSYVYGATGPSSYDCSGFVQYCYSQAGISLPRTSWEQGSCGSRTSNPQPGDIVYYGGHVGIYMGGGMMIDAGNPSVGVSYRAVYGSPSYVSVV